MRCRRKSVLRWRCGVRRHRSATRRVAKPSEFAFGLGQILGPIATGAITDAMGSLAYALNMSAAVLVLDVIACLFQKPLTAAANQI